MGFHALVPFPVNPNQDQGPNEKDASPRLGAMVAIAVAGTATIPKAPPTKHFFALACRRKNNPQDLSGGLKNVQT